jgi:hypothetical protein
MCKHWDALRQARPGQIGSYTFIPYALGGLATSAQLSEVEDFFADKRGPVS